MAEYTNIVPPRVAFLDPESEFISREWYQFFFSLFQLTGGGTNSISLADLQVGPPPVDAQTISALIPDFPVSMADTNAIQALTMTQDDTLTWLSMHT